MLNYNTQSTNAKQSTASQFILLTLLYCLLDTGVITSLVDCLDGKTHFQNDQLCVGR